MTSLAPGSAVVALDDRLLDLVDPDARPELIASGFEFTEGPVWDARNRCLVFSDIRRRTLYRWSERDGLLSPLPAGRGLGRGGSPAPPVPTRPDVTVLREHTNGANGNTFDPSGRLLSCEKETRRVSRMSPDGLVETLAGHYEGGRFSSPNDLICLANGDVIFTDPPFGLRQPDGSIAGRETSSNGVYRVRARDGAVTLLSGQLEAPNGLVMRDDGQTLIVADFFARSLLAFDIDAAGAAHNPRTFATVQHGESTGRPDGMKLDARGNLYVAANTSDGIWVFAPAGELIGFLALPESPSNCAWGDDDWRSLYVTTHASIYRLRLRVRGQRLNP